jgi:hypothetical protein
MATIASPLLALVLLLAAPVVSLAGEPVHLILLCGQSNMAGMDPARIFTPEVEKHFGAENVVIVKVARSGQPIRLREAGPHAAWVDTDDLNDDAASKPNDLHYSKAGDDCLVGHGSGRPTYITAI